MMHDCRSFGAWLDATLSGKTTDASAERMAREHRDACSPCRTYEILVRGNEVHTLPDAPGDFARDVLQRTSGSACGRARHALSEAHDGPRNELDRILLESHVAHCAECRNFGQVLGKVLEVLPSMARIAPREEFLPGVLSATSKQRTPFSPLQWLAAAWQRPRFSLEVGFVAAVVVWMMLGLDLGPAGPLTYPPG